jgi:ABC-2 type transport system ATP-binding protein
MFHEEFGTIMSGGALETYDLTKIFKPKIGGGTLSTLIGKKEHRFVKAVDHLNLKVEKGELFGLLGPNGAGKTTLVKMLCTLLPPDIGTASVNGYDIVKESMNVKKSIGTLFSIGDHGFFWRLNGYRNLEFFSAVYNVPRKQREERITKVLELVGLEEEALVPFQKYSGGMRRKLSLARALLPDPPILLLDEPTIALDVLASRSIREFIKNNLSKKMGKTVLYTTHYIEEASQICDKVAIMNKGRLVALDTPEALRNMVKKGESVEIVVESLTNEQIEMIKRVDGVQSAISKTEGLAPGQMQLRIRLESLEDLPVVLNFLFTQRIRLLNFKRDEPTLEDAFVELTGKGLCD